MAASRAPEAIVSRSAAERPRRLSRREFARGAALAAGAAVVAPGWLAAGAEEPPAGAAPQPAPPAPDLPPDLAAEAEARIQAILRAHGGRFDAAQQAEIRRIVTASMAGLAAFRAFPLGNADEPATALRPFRRER
jgi:hypothetical protein